MFREDPYGLYCPPGRVVPGDDWGELNPPLPEEYVIPNGDWCGIGDSEVNRPVTDPVHFGMDQV